MKKLVLLLFFSNFILTSFAQDTTIIQTLSFSDISQRRGWYVFPPDTGSFQKVLMYYTLKCDPQTPWDGYNCGEWDYTTYTNVYDYQNKTSYIHTINSTTPDSIPIAFSPSYTRYQSYQYYPVYDATLSENLYPTGSSGTSLSEVFRSAQRNGKSQFMWTAAELTSAGLSAGDINKLQLEISALGSSLSDLKIKIKHSALIELTSSSYEKTGFTEVYHLNTTFPGTGLYTFNFSSPFTWDGTSNVVIEFSFSNANIGINSDVVASASGFNSGIYAVQDDPFLEFNTPDYVVVNSNEFNQIDSFITISFWQYGNPLIQPSDDYIFEGRDANNNRVLNAHLPWSNSNVYWDAGSNGTSSYDRINKIASSSDFEGKWNHWAFTKNVATGKMMIYLNGSLFHSGTGMTRRMYGVSKFVIGGTSSGNGKGVYDGSINDFAIFNKELDSVQIQNWMYQDINPTHPFYSNLIYYFDMNEYTGTQLNSVSASGADLIGYPGWRQTKGEGQFRNIQTLSDRPDVVFVQGNYLTHLDSISVVDSTMNDAVSILKSLPFVNVNVNGMSYNYTDTFTVWKEEWTYTYNQSGNKIDSVFHSADSTLYNLFKANTIQIQNYVTPYGIGFDLGPNGTRFVYDVSEYRWWLKDTVDLSAHNTQELIDLKFVFISGTPPRNLLSAESIWTGDWNHADIVNDVVLPAVSKNTLANATQFIVRTRTTGHGFGGGSLNCAEFCPRNHRLYLDGNLNFQWLNWKTCATNPLISQGGTWIYDRAGWCPGTFADTYNHDISSYVTPGQPISIDYGMEPMQPGGTDGNYRIAVQFFQYGPPNFNLDVAVEEIISPNNWEYHKRVNPICGNAKVRIKNTGATTLTSVDLKYRCIGGYYKTYTWTGSLAFMDTISVDLPINDPNWWGPSDVFEVKVENPNGQADQYAGNNIMTAKYTAPPMYTGNLIVWLFSNNAPTETKWYVYDENRNLVGSRTSFPPMTLNKDTVVLTPGCYSFEVYDSDDDGIAFFANSDGNGYVRLRSTAGGLNLNFDPDFGRFIKHQFTIGYEILDVQEKTKSSYMYVYPNPNHGSFKIEVDGFSGNYLLYEVYNSIGQKMYSEQNGNTKQMHLQEITLEDLPNGMYYVRVSDGLQFKSKQIIINK